MEDYDKLSELANELIKAPHSRIVADGLEEFATMCETVRDRFFHAPVKVGRGSLMVKLGCLAADIRQYPERFSITTTQESGAGSAVVESTASARPRPKRNLGRELGLAKPRLTEPHPNPMGALPIPQDPDDEPW